MGGERAAHLAHGGPQAPGDLEAVLLHQKGRDLLPGVALGHPDGGDGGQPHCLVERATGLNPGEPREGRAQQGDRGLLSSIQPPQGCSQLPSAAQPGEMGSPHPPPPSRRARAPAPAAPGTGGCSWPGASPTSSPGPGGTEESVGPRCRYLWLPPDPATGQVSPGAPCHAAHHLRQHGQALPQAEEAVDGCCVVVPAKPNSTRVGSAPAGRLVQTPWGWRLTLRGGWAMGRGGRALLPPPRGPTQGSRAFRGLWGGREATRGGTACPHMRGLSSQPQ